jgi:two-component system response regulator AtoC
MPGLNGLETLKRIKEITPFLETIMVTAVNDIQKASEAIKLGARDYVVKPFEVEQIIKITEQLLRKKSILNEGTKASSAQEKTPPQLLGQSDKILKVLDDIEKIKKDERVLILGEAGVEKEAAARILHEKSSRSNFPFLAFSLSEEMPLSKIRNILFGQEKGASTVDLKSQSGILEQSREGTLFIDNLECLPEEIFKAFSSLEFSRTGSSTKSPIQSRLIGGGASDLAVRNKEIFNFFSQILIEIPPLRERISDLPILVNNFIELFSSRYQKELKITPSALSALSDYPWPGNVMELESLIERFFLFPGASREIRPEDLPLDILLKSSGNIGGDFLSRFEKEYIRTVFEKSGKDKEAASLLLGINPTVLETKI